MVRAIALATALLLAACASAAPDDDTPTETTPNKKKIKTTTPPGTPGATPPDATMPPPAPVSPRMQKFLDQRDAALRSLAQPILTCVARNDTEHPAFHGCIDWHSSVHGTWALLALSRMTKDPAFENATAAVLNPALLSQELADLESNALAEELPYGYAWFLLLAHERAKSGKTDLVAFSDQIANRLDAWMSTLGGQALTSSLLADEYTNLSWPVINLWRYANDRANPSLAAKVVSFARSNLLPHDADCPLGRSDLDGFFPACLHRAHALVTLLPEAELKPWLDAFVPKSFALTPISTPAAAHNGGLNFSRSWGLYSLYKATGNAVYGDLYLDHMESWLTRGDLWATDYANYAHWVAQFGVYAIALTYE